MNNENSDRPSDELIFRALVPKGFRPTTDVEIDRMLDGLGSAEVSQSKLQRMLGKIKGTIPKAWEESVEPQADREAELAATREMAELFSARGETIPPEIEAKLRELEKLASEPASEDENSDAD